MSFLSLVKIAILNTNYLSYFYFSIFMFSEKVYFLTKKVPKGRVTTYKELAKKLKTKAYRAVGQALKCNPYAPKVPCHRVVKSVGT